MTPRAREIEALVLAMFAAAPLYLTHAIGAIPLIAFHAAMTAMLLRVVAGKSPEIIPARLMRWLAFAYLPFYVVDVAMISRNPIAASAHLILFIAVYQPIEALQRRNEGQRMLTTTLIFVASVATSTHITIVLFVIAFALLTIRQLMALAHAESVRSIEREYAEPASGRAALFYLAGATAIAAMLFPLLPRVRNPFVQGLPSSLPGATTGLSETIDFRNPRTANPGDTTVVARVWMDREASLFFTPLRLRGNIYDYFDEGEWKQSYRGLREVSRRNGAFVLARAGGLTRAAVMQQRPQRGKLFIPVGTYAVSGLTNLYEGPSRETYYSYSQGMLNLDLNMAYRPEPLRLVRATTSGYPISPGVAALARRIVGSEQDPARRGEMIEQYLMQNYRYIPNTGTPPVMSLDDFLLRRRAGHCEYFAAGMVALLNAVDVQARIAGGFYGGRVNPLTGYYTIRRDDAHAWTEVWDGKRWLTFDATPAALRPGTEAGSAWRTYLTALSDSVTYFWDRYVLTFGLSDQVTLIADLMTWARDNAGALRGSMRRSLAELTAPDFGVTFAVLVIAGGVAVIFARRRRSPFDLLAAHLSQRGIEVGPAMTMEDALARLREIDPDAARALEPLIALYEEEEFSGRRNRERRRVLRRRLAEL